VAGISEPNTSVTGYAKKKVYLCLLAGTSSHPISSQPAVEEKPLVKMGLISTLCCCFRGQNSKASGASPAYRECPDEEPLEEVALEPEVEDLSNKK